MNRPNIVITLARKPPMRTVASNARRHGTGGINIDGCRIGLPRDDSRPGRGVSDGNHSANLPSLSSDWGAWETHKGRWPANLVLEHKPGCRCIGERLVQPLEGHRPNPVGVQSDGTIQFNRKPEGYQKTSYTSPDGTETVLDWDCEPGCPVAELDARSNCPTRGPAILRRGATTGKGIGYGSSAVGQEVLSGYSDVGGASRFFFQIQLEPRQR